MPNAVRLSCAGCAVLVLAAIWTLFSKSLQMRPRQYVSYRCVQESAARLLTWFYVGPQRSPTMDPDASDRSSASDNQCLIASSHTLDVNGTTPRCFRVVPLPAVHDDTSCFCTGSLK